MKKLVLFWPIIEYAKPFLPRMQLELRWGFLIPWCNTLSKRFDYNNVEFEDVPSDMQKRRLQVTLPMRKFCSDEETFRTKFHQVRETLLLLSAVAHVDK